MRLPDWQSRLAAVIDAKQRGAFAWGQNDCSIFVCDAIAAITGIDPGEAFRGKYDTPLAGARLVSEWGGLESMVDALTDRYGFVEIKPAFAHRGDLGLYRNPTEGDTLGINIGPSFAFLMERGMTYLPQSSLARAWRVG